MKWIVKGFLGSLFLIVAIPLEKLSYDVLVVFIRNYFFLQYF